MRSAPTSVDEARPRAEMVLRSAVVIVVANLATMVLELIASRVLAPFVGASLHTWTAIIGVVLAGLSGGSFAGGRLADRAHAPRLVAVVLVAAGLSVLVMVSSVGLVATAVDGRPLVLRALVLATWCFFLPTLLLSCVSPLLLRALLPGVGWAGRLAGGISALGALGSLAGTFLTGFVLIANFGVSQIVLGTGLAIVATGLLALTGACAPALGPGPLAAPPRDADRLAPVHLERSQPTRPTGRLEVNGVGRTSHAPGAQPVEPTPAGLSLGFGRAAGFFMVVVAGTSCCLLAIELAASRLLAPTLGVSLLSWTGIIGVVLLGVVTGNTLGGFIADRWPRQDVLARSLLLAAAGCLWVPVSNRLIIAHHWLDELGLMSRIVLHAGLVFLPATIALATVSPQVLRVTVRDVSVAGSLAGRLWAAATLGSLAGTFLTGWVLISLIGVYPLVASAAGLLLVLGVLVGEAWRHLRRLTEATALLVVMLSLVALGLFRSPCTVETDFYCIEVLRSTYEGRQVKLMMLDLLAHTIIDPSDPTYLGYDHDTVQAEFVRRAVHHRPQARVLVIGGGGYALPRWIEENLPAARVEVVELDPAVTRVALEQFGVRADTRIVSHNLDGRQFMQQVAPATYDVVIQDAVNDLAVPFHLMTREYDQLVRSRLTDGGIFLVSVIDQMPAGVFVPAAVKTLRAAYPFVELVRAAQSTGARQVQVIAASNQPLDLDGLAPLLASLGAPAACTVRVPAGEIEPRIGPTTPVLTDEYAPVDALLANVFLARP